MEKICPSTVGTHLNPQTLKAKKGNVSESLISAKNTEFGDKLTIKKSYIGPNCSLGSNVKVENSILLSRVRLHNE